MVSGIRLDHYSLPNSLSAVAGVRYFTGHVSFLLPKPQSQATEESLFLHLTDTFPGLAGFIGAKDNGSGEWWQLKLQDVQSSSQIVTTNKQKPKFLQDALPVAQPTVSSTDRKELKNHWKQINSQSTQEVKKH